MKRMLLAGLLATTALSAFAAGKDKDKPAKKADCGSCCAQCKAKDCPPDAPKK